VGCAVAPTMLNAKNPSWPMDTSTSLSFASWSSMPLLDALLSSLLIDSSTADSQNRMFCHTRCRWILECRYRRPTTLSAGVVRVRGRAGGGGEGRAGEWKGSCHQWSMGTREAATPNSNGGQGEGEGGKGYRAQVLWAGCHTHLVHDSSASMSCTIVLAERQRPASK
jgi:hypothetical protein